MKSNDIENIIAELGQWGNIVSAMIYLQKKVCILNNWPYAELWMPDKNSKFMTWGGYWSNKEEYFEKFSKYSACFKFPKGIGLIGRVWQQNELQWVNDISTDKNILRTEVAVKSKLNSAICFPIIYESDVRSILSFFMEDINDVDLKNADVIFSLSNKIGKIIESMS